MGHFGIQPGHFWEMSPHEFFLLHDTRRERDPEIDYAGRLTERDCSELYEVLE